MRRTVAAPMSSISASPGYFARHRGDRIAFNLFILYICFLSRQIESINGASVVTRGEPSPRQTRQTREKRYDPPELPAHRHRRFEHRRHRRPARHGARAMVQGTDEHMVCQAAVAGRYQLGPEIVVKGKGVAVRVELGGRRI